MLVMMYKGQGKGGRYFKGDEGDEVCIDGSSEYY